MYELFQETADALFEAARREGRLLHNLPDDELRAMALAEPEVRETTYGSLVVESEPMSRAAMFTQNNVDTPFGEPERKLLADAERRLAGETIVSIDVEVGDGSEGVTARLIVPRQFAHLAYAGRKLFRPAASGEPRYQVIIYFDEAFETNRQKPLPRKDITIRMAFSPGGKLVKVVRNSNYFGEWKKGVFTGEDYRVKQGGDAIFLHAGCRRDTLETTRGDLATSHSLFVALSANGKTSTTCKVLARKGRERSWLIQDDGGTLSRDGQFRGFEAGGLFVKTDSLSPADQIEAYYACLKRHTFLENVHVDPDGSIDFFNCERTSNGRAVIERRDFMHASHRINAERVDNLFLITRGPIIPAVARLTHEQAAAFMVLGQSMESSAGDPTQAGKIKNEFFYDPFVAGDRAQHANLFYDILQDNPHVNCYLLNTGSVGEGRHMHDIRLADTMGILDSILRGGAQHWAHSASTGLEVARSLRMIDSILLHPQKLYPHSEFERLQRELNRHRAEAIERYPGLDPKIRDVFQSQVGRPVAAT
jgi:phosphoenolpyruvate carboxykinase (ATP)